jgi:hypothetical protein
MQAVLVGLYPLGSVKMMLGGAVEEVTVPLRWTTPEGSLKNAAVVSLPGTSFVQPFWNVGSPDEPTSL